MPGTKPHQVQVTRHADIKADEKRLLCDFREDVRGNEDLRMGPDEVLPRADKSHLGCTWDLSGIHR